MATQNRSLPPQKGPAKYQSLGHEKKNELHSDHNTGNTNHDCGKDHSSEPVKNGYVKTAMKKLNLIVTPDQARAIDFNVLCAEQKVKPTPSLALVPAWKQIGRAHF